MNKLVSGIYGAFVSRSRELFILGITLIITGLLFSKLLVSLGSFTILGSWLLSGHPGEKFVSFLRNKTAVAIGLIYIVHLLGMLYTTDYEYGLKDLRIKLPLILFPVVFSTSRPLSEKEFRFFHFLFITAVTISSLISTYLWLFGDEIYVSEKRNLSVFISHIRLSLMVCLVEFACLYYLTRSKSLSIRILLLLLMLWFPFFLIIMESFTGLVVLISTSIISLLFVLWKNGRKRTLVIVSGVLLLCLMVPAIYLNGLYNEFMELQEPKELPFRTKTKYGEAYSHPALNNPNPSRQNGYIVYQNVAWKELTATWNKNSQINFDSNAYNGYPVHHIVFWYLTSKGWNKDAEAIEALKKEEIKAIERGVSNYIHLGRPGVEARILQTFWEISHYLEGGDFNGHSITMRWEFWKTAIAIVKQHLVFGVGTGDIKQAFADQYEADKSSLDPKWRLRTHNQYLSFAVAFGLIGFLIILYAFFYPVFRGQRHNLYFVFCCILFLSMINEDTLETQTGVTLFAFFNAFYLFMAPKH